MPIRSLTCILGAAALLLQVVGLVAVPDCPAVGCTASKSPVCGSDGNTYQNECFASCQGVASIAQGPCTLAAGNALATAAAAAGEGVSPSSTILTMSAGDYGRIAAHASTVANGFFGSTRVVTLQDMHRYASEGMVLVGTLLPVDNFKPSTRRVPRNARSFRSKVKEADAAAAEAAVTPDGFIYKFKSPAEQVARAQSFTAQLQAEGVKSGAAPGFDPSASVATPSVSDITIASAAASDNIDAAPTSEPGPPGAPVATENAAQLPMATGNRKLRTIYGDDDRREITSQQPFPWSAHGFIEFTTDLHADGEYGTCSGAVIGPNAVLTAAHCILGSTGTAARSWQFSANRVASGVDARFGTVGWRRVFYNTGYWTNQPNGWWLWDIAIVILDTDLGARTGYFGYGWAAAGYTGSLATAGYPGDKDYGSFWYISGGTACYVKDTNGKDSYLENHCDIMGGQSGSPMWIPKKRVVRAVVSAGNDDFEIACAINKYWFDYIKANRFKTS